MPPPLACSRLAPVFPLCPALNLAAVTPSWGPPSPALSRADGARRVRRVLQARLPRPEGLPPARLREKEGPTVGRQPNLRCYGGPGFFSLVATALLVVKHLMLILRSPMLACARAWPTEVEVTIFAGLVAHIHAVGGSLGSSPIRAADSIARLALAGERFLRGVEKMHHTS